MKLCNKITDVLEAHGINAYPPVWQRSPSQESAEIYCEIEFYSPEGEDVLETVWYDGTDAGFVKGFRKNAEDFDPDEHAELWIDSRGQNGVPNSIRDLIDDADAIREKLLYVADRLESLKI